MPAKLIYEVRQRAVDPDLMLAGLDRELGFFTDEDMAEHTIFALYRQVWTTVVDASFQGSEWFPASLKPHLLQAGWDFWYAEQQNSTLPIFYKVEHKLWNQVPSGVNNFTFEDHGDPF